MPAGQPGSEFFDAVRVSSVESVAALGQHPAGESPFGAIDGAPVWGPAVPGDPCDELLGPGLPEPFAAYLVAIGPPGVGFIEDTCRGIRQFPFPLEQPEPGQPRGEASLFAIAGGTQCGKTSVFPEIGCDQLRGLGVGALGRGWLPPARYSRVQFSNAFLMTSVASMGAVFGQPMGKGAFSRICSAQPAGSPTVLVDPRYQVIDAGCPFWVGLVPV